MAKIVETPPGSLLRKAPGGAGAPRRADLPFPLSDPHVFMQYLSLGDTHDIAASCHYLNLAGTGLILDAGMDPDKDGPEALPPFEWLEDLDVDHVLVSHAHHDHMGAMPVITDAVPHARVHVSEPTARLAEILLPSSARLQRRRRREGETPHPPAFDVETAEAMTYLMDIHELDTDFDLTGLKAEDHLTARFYHAGHVLGAVGIYVEAREGDRLRRVFYTADTSVQPQTILPAASYPAPPLDVLFLETTLGADPEAEQTTRKAEERKFADAIKRTLGRGGVVLVPVFALGRSQDVLAMIDRFKRRGDIPDETPVYTVGSMRAVAGVYDETRLSTPRLDPDFQVWNVDQQRLPRSTKRLAEALREPGIFVVSSGMLFEHTASNSIAQRIIGEEKHSVLFVGYAVEDSPAFALREAAEEGPGTKVTLSEEAGEQTLRAEVQRYRFSGHAHRRDLLKLVGQTQPETVVLVHGETEAKTWMKDNIEFHHPTVKVLLPETGEMLTL